MYQTIAMLKPGYAFSVADMHEFVKEVASSGSGNLSQSGNTSRLSLSANYLTIGFSDAPHVAVESKELADTDGLPCGQSTNRIEICGEDPDMDLFNDYLIIAEKLHGTGKFVVYDLVAGKLMFPEK